MFKSILPDVFFTLSTMRGKHQLGLSFLILGGGDSVVARERRPERDQAKQMCLDSGGQMKLKDIAAALSISEQQEPIRCMAEVI